MFRFVWRDVGLARIRVRIMARPSSKLLVVGMAIKRYQISDTWSFVRVAYIHNAGYLGGLVGLIVALVVIHPSRNDCCAQ